MAITVEVRGGNLEKAMRVLKKKVQKAGIVKEARDRQYFMKPSEKKREKAKEEGTNADEKEELEIKTMEELLEESKEEVKESFEDWFGRLDKIRRSDRFESYINSFLHVYDPHTDYFKPKEKADFDIRMSGKLEGIGARLSPDGDYTKVVSKNKSLSLEIISGVKRSKIELFWE